MALNNKYPVLNDSGKPIIIQIGGANLTPSTPTIPVFSKTGKPLIIALGSSYFQGNGASGVSAAVAHAIGLGPSWVDIFPALTSSGLPWGAMTYQHAPADNVNFYVDAFTPSGAFGVGINYFFNWLAIAQIP